jgi:hypothetical protein
MIADARDAMVVVLPDAMVADLPDGVSAADEEVGEERLIEAPRGGVQLQGQGYT